MSDLDVANPAQATDKNQNHWFHIPK